MTDLNYNIYLIEPNGNYAILDTEGINFNTLFTLSDIKDISTKKDTLSKNLTFKGTKNNNRIFGNVFNPSRFVDNKSEENLFVNFSVNKEVECFVLENSTPILKGFLKFSSATINKGIISYECIITGNVFNFYSQLGDLQLSDLDFSEYAHVYRVSNISGSWLGANFVSGTSIYTKGYVYPLISYGENVSPNSQDVGKIHISNFRPSIFTRKYLDKIFQQDALSGFTYELKGNNTFIDNFDSTFLPSNSDILSQSKTGVQLFAFNLNSTQTYDNNVADTTLEGTYKHIVKFPDSPSVYLNTITYNSGTQFGQNLNSLFTWNRTVTSDLAIHFNSVYAKNNSNKNLNVYLRVYSRPKVLPVDASGAWGNTITNFGVIAETFVKTIVPGEAVSRTDMSLNIAQTTFQLNTEFFVCLELEQPDNQRYNLKFVTSVNGVTIRTPSDTNSLVKYSVLYNDTIVPEAVENVKQKDFVKSLCSLFNLYTYSTLNNPKHIIFQPYDDYYEFCKPQNIRSKVLDYTQKIDYSDKVIFSSYGELAKKYTFTYKADSDYFNTLYTNDYKSIYGEYNETDSLGSVDEKKVELIFSPTPVVNYGNTGRITPEIYKSTDGINKTPYSSNVRILYYNGVKSCAAFPYQIGEMAVNGFTYTFTPYAEIPTTGIFTLYPQASHIRYGTGETNFNYYSDLNFGECARYYFPANAKQIFTVPNAYDAYYSNQLRELTDLNNALLEVKANISETDVSNLNLRQPIFIQNQYGNAYYKVLEVDYQNRNEPSTLKLQKINVETYLQPAIISGSTGGGTGSTLPDLPPVIMI